MYLESLNALIALDHMETERDHMETERELVEVKKLLTYLVFVHGEKIRIDKAALAKMPNLDITINDLVDYNVIEVLVWEEES